MSYIGMHDKGEKMIIAIDIDGVLCPDTHENWKDIEPRKDAIEFINLLYNSGHIIHIRTSRGVKDNNISEALASTDIQLKKWGLKYHKLESKPFYDLIVDDKALNSIDTLKKVFEKVSLDLRKN